MDVPLILRIRSKRKIGPMKTLSSLLFLAAFTASGSAATMIYLDPTAFFNSSAWSNAASGATFTENFVASGGIHNFTGNEEFTSSSYTYGSGSLQNTMNISRLDAPAKITVDTTNESGGFRSYDNPGTISTSSKYLYVPADGGAGGDAIKFLFSQPVSAFSFRLGDFGDPTAGGNVWSWLDVRVRNTAYPDPSQILISDPWVNEAELGKTLDLSASGYPSGRTGVSIGNRSWAFLGWTFDTPVDEVTIMQRFANNDSWGVDTISFATTTAVVNPPSAVPEPATVVSLAGLLCSGAFLRRRSA